MNVYLVDGTYELFRHFFALPSHLNGDGEEVAATRGVLASLITLLEQGPRMVGIATDHIIESFRNELWAGYKTSAGIDPELWSQFPLLEDVLAACGFTVWAMVEFEADDALASAAAVAVKDKRVNKIYICTPDKDLAQCVKNPRVVQWDRRNNVEFDEDRVKEKFGVGPASIPDYLALVGDSADGFPGLPGWGAKSASAVLARYGSLEAIPESAANWELEVRGASKLAQTLRDYHDQVLLFRTLARLRADVPVGSVDHWAWEGPTDQAQKLCARIDALNLFKRLDALVS